MKSFARTFFTHFGANIEEQRDEWVVELPPELVETFGKPRLYLVFPQPGGEARELSPTEDLLVYGSRTFDQMLALLAGRGETAHLHFPVTIAADGDPVPLHNCRIIEREDLYSGDELYYIFHFRAIYLSDEKQEAFITIALDADGESVPDKVEMLTGIDQALLAPDQPPQIESETLSAMLDSAVEIAYGQIEAEAAEIEKAVLLRLEKVLLRLSTYYSLLMAEIDTEDNTQTESLRADLQQDLDRKIDDELERHRLRVTLTPISYALALVPFAEYRLHLATRHTQQIIVLKQNLHTGQVAHFRFVEPDTLADVDQPGPFACHHCQNPIEHLALCDKGHAVHPYCLDTCHRCGRDGCHACGIQPCAICGEVVCVDCVVPCAHCEQWLCAEHIDTCAICGDSFCTDHGFQCRWCHQVYGSHCEQDGACATCRSAWAAGPASDLLPPEIGGQKINRYRWRRAENTSYTIYIGQHFVWGKFIVVTNKSKRVVYWEKIGTLRWWFGRRNQ